MPLHPYLQTKKVGMGTKKDREQKKEWAKLLFIRENLSQKEIAEKVGISTVTINKWAQADGWTKLKQSMLTTRETQLSRLYMQLDELNTMIMSREAGSRFADSKEADEFNKNDGNRRKCG
jgi:uncharacterized protein YjcR